MLVRGSVESSPKPSISEQGYGVIYAAHADQLLNASLQLNRNAGVNGYLLHGSPFDNSWRSGPT